MPNKHMQQKAVHCCIQARVVLKYLDHVSDAYNYILAIWHCYLLHNIFKVFEIHISGTGENFGSS